MFYKRLSHKMNKESETEQSLYLDIVKNLGHLMNDGKLTPKNDYSRTYPQHGNPSSKCVGSSIGIKQQRTPPNMTYANQETTIQKSQLDYQQQYFAHIKQLEILMLQNPSLQYLNIYAYIQQLNVISQQLGWQRNQMCETKSPSCVWSGVFPTKNYHINDAYSNKIFLGGIPWSFGNDDLKKLFQDYGQIRVEWPKDEKFNQLKGYAYIIFESEKNVHDLLTACKMNNNYQDDSYFFKLVISGKTKMAEIVPWTVSDSCYINCAQQNLDVSKTVFLGGIHGKLTAVALAKVMNDLFGGVAFVGIDIDEYNYPKGAGRVIFNNQHSYMRAVAAKFIYIKTEKIQKKIQIDPFVQDSLCSSCGVQRGKYFCRDVSCFRYFCCQCWNARHFTNISFQGHKPLTRNSNSQQQSPSNNCKPGTRFVGKKNLAKPSEVNVTINKSGKKKSGCGQKARI